ncbi:MAG TPA: nucleotidyl transferase AbiEii/AbiGii toxin family protein [Opitutaceae bacterium]
MNIARAGGSDLDLLLRRFGVERLLFRISQSEFADAFVLKGAMLFIVWGKSLPRPTRDADLLAFGPSGIGAVAARFREIREVDVIPDGLEFDATMLSVEPIREDNDYGGLRVAVVARLGSAALGRDRAERRRLIERKLSELREEQRRLEEELHELEYVPTASAARVCAIPAPPATPAAKVALFLELFGARRTVYPRFWENARTAKKGYSPVCTNDRRPGICEKPHVRCAECPNQRFLQLDEAAIERHLRGEETLGVYVIREDDTCIFLTVCGQSPTRC